jgi:hypothetical protein
MTRKNGWTEAEDEVVKKAVETGRSEGMSGKAIAKRLYEGGHMPNHPFHSIMWRISLKCPLRRGTKHKVKTNSMNVKMNRLERLLCKRTELSAQAASIKSKLDEVENELKYMIN